MLADDLLHPTFGDLLRRFRRQRHLTQEELAEQAAISVDTISLLERGQTHAPQRATIQTLAVALSLSSEELASFVAAARTSRDEAETATVDAATSGRSPAAPSSALTLDRGHLPLPLTALIGREHDLDTLVALLARPTTRLLTLTGPAGVGKTRLALELGATLRRHEPAREVVFVDLIPVHEPAGVLAAIARAIGLQESGDLALLDALILTLRARRLVLLLDNFEQVLSAARHMVELVQACPEVQAVVTSRAPLNVRGERCYLVAPLALPDADGNVTLEELCRVPSIALFLERADGGWQDSAIPTRDDGRMVADICTRLDGLPLAIELAAARMRSLGLSQLHDLLHKQEFLGVLAQGPQDLADHQRTMRSTVAWSYGLLARDEQHIIRALGVFAGGATAEAVQMVADLDAETVLAGLAALVDANLARRVDDPEGSRYDLFVIVRAYALERLREWGELEEARRRLADYVGGLVEQVDPIGVSVQTALMNQLLREHDNLRAVLEWMLERGELLRGQRIGARLRGLWEQRGLAVEGADWLERLLARAEEPHTPEELDAQVEAWKVLVVMHHRLSHFRRAAEVGERVLDLSRQQGDATRLASALNYLANPLGQLGEYDRAEALYQEGLALHREQGDSHGEMVELLNLGELRTFQGRYEEALAFGQQALAISRSLAEQESSLGLILSNLGETYLMMDRPAEARTILLESQRVYEAYDQPSILALYHLGRTCWRLGAFAEALAYLERTMKLSRHQDDVAALVQELSIVAAIALDQNDLASARAVLEEVSAAQARVSDARFRWRVVERAAGYACRRGPHEAAVRLYAAAEQVRSLLHDLVDPAERDLRARDLDALYATLGDSPCDELVASGHALQLEEALDLARQMLDEEGAAANRLPSRSGVRRRDGT